MTPGSLMRDIPRLEPDDEFVDQLAQLAAASKPSRGGIVIPVAFQGPAARSIAAAAAVAAIAAGGAVAATQLHPHTNSPLPPTSSVSTSGADDDHSPRHHRTARGADPSETSARGAGPSGNDASAPDSSSTTNHAVVPNTDDHRSPGSDDSPGDHHTGGPGADDPADHETGDEHGGGPHGSDQGSDQGSHGGSDDGSNGGSDGGSQDNSGGKDKGGDSASDLDGSGD